jgi:hypothetical protein
MKTDWVWISSLTLPGYFNLDKFLCLGFLMCEMGLMEPSGLLWNFSLWTLINTAWHKLSMKEMLVITFLIY